MRVKLAVILGNGNDDPAELSSFIDYDTNIFNSNARGADVLPPDSSSVNRCASPPSCLPTTTLPAN